MVMIKLDAHGTKEILCLDGCRRIIEGLKENDIQIRLSVVFSTLIMSKDLTGKQPAVGEYLNHKTNFYFSQNCS